MKFYSHGVILYLAAFMRQKIRPILTLSLAWVGLFNLASQAATAQELIESAPPPSRSMPAFPLKLSDDRRYLVDQKGNPFLLVGDSPWSMIVEPTPQQVDLYLDDRAGKGFDAVLVNLLEHKFSSKPPNRSDGTPPFIVAGHFAAPNESYFRYAEEVISKAERRGIVVLLCASYLGYGGGDEGFYQEMLRCGPKKIRAYGRYVGKRFRNHPNLVWVVGGDFTPPSDKRWTVDQLAAGIKDEDSVHLMTVHCNQGDAAGTQYPDRSWLQLNSVYHYREDLYAAFVEPDCRVPRLPCFLMETAYEGEHQSTPDRIRRQAYWPLLSGGCGFLYGNSPLWHFASRGVFDKGGDWVAAMKSRGAQDIAHLAAVFRGVPWWLLRPDRDHKVVTAGFGTFGKMDYVATARTTDGRLALSYFAATGKDARDLTIDPSQLTGPVAARWFNPADGRFTPVPGSPFANSGSRQIQTPGDNGTGTNDWLLILETQTDRTPR
jgi:hypothetical protein